MEKSKTIIIAEIGVNHNGRLDIAKKLIDISKKAGVDYVKFQVYKTEELVLKNTKKANYQKKNELSKNQFDMLKKYEISEFFFQSVYNYCKKKKIGFLASPFDIQSAKLILKTNPKFLKIPSGEITNFQMLTFLSKFKKKILLSTGMCNQKELFNILTKITKITGIKKNFLIPMHCISEYPSKLQDQNLNFLKKIKTKYNEYGFSDHTSGFEASMCAVALGAKYIEKHITLSKNMYGPDHLASLDRYEIFDFVKKIRRIESCLGLNTKILSKEEIKNKKVARKSIFAKQNIKKGENFTEKNIKCSRPGIYLSADNWNKILNRKSRFYFKKNSPIKI